MNTMRAGRDELAKKVASDRIKVEMYRNIPVAADFKIKISDEVLVFGKRPVSK